MNVSLFVLVAILGSLSYVLLAHGRKQVAKLATMSLSLSLLAAVGMVPSATAMAGPASQAALTITNSSLTVQTGSHLTLAVSGGSGSGAVSFATTSAGCTVGAATGVVSNSGAGACAITITKAASTGYKVAVKSTQVKFVDFAQSTLSIANSTLTGTDGVAIAVTTAGGSGSGAVTYTASGKGCAIDASGSLTDTAASTCSVVATKAASLGWKVAKSAKANFVFAGAPQSGFAISNGLRGGAVGTMFTITTVGGSGTGNVTLSVVGANCTLHLGVLTAMSAGTCAVTATKAASVGYVAATASASFLFCTGGCTNNPTYTSPDKATLTSIKGLTSSAPTLLNDTVSGLTSFINNYWNPADRWLQGYIDAGATVTMTWHVTGSFGQPLANQAVTLIDNADYACTVGIKWTATSLNTNPGCGGGTQGTLAGTTDANGDVVFTLVNNNTAAQSSARPSDMTTTSGYEANEKSAAAWTRFFLAIGTDTYTAGSPTCSAASGGWGDGCMGAGANQASDLVDLNVLQPSGYVAPQIENPTTANPDKAVVTAVTGAQGATLDNTTNADNWFIFAYFQHTDRLLYNYVNAGDTVTMTWHVTGSYGQPLANQAVTLTDHGDGNNRAHFTGAGSATTDANGNVTFTLVNTDSASGTRPSDLTSADAANMIEYNNAQPFIRYVLTVGSDVIVTPGINQATDFSDLIVIPPVGWTPAPVVANANTPTFANPDIASATSITGLVAGTGMNNDTVNGCNWWLCSSWHTGDQWTENYVTAGSTIVENWHVTGADGNPMVNKAVTLVVHQSGPDLNFTATGINPDSTLSGTTDANGNVSFTLTNTDSSSGLTCPSGMTAPGNANEGTNPWSRSILIVGAASGWNGNPYWAGNATDFVTYGAATQETDSTDLIVVPVGCSAAAPAPAATGDNPTAAHPDVATLVSQTGVSANSTSMNDDTANGDQWFIWQYFVASDHWYESYVNAGATVTQTWNVTGTNGAPLANTAVTLETNYAGPDANWTANGMSQPWGTVAGTTDANGNVTFTFTNTDSGAGLTCPSTDSMNMSGNGNEGAANWTRTVLVVGTPTSVNGNAVDNLSGGGLTQGTDLNDLIVVPAGC